LARSRSGRFFVCYVRVDYVNLDHVFAVDAASTGNRAALAGRPIAPARSLLRRQPIRFIRLDNG